MELDRDLPLSKSLGFWVNGLARLIRLTLENQLKEIGLTPTTWTLLMALREEDQLSQTDLARRTLLDGATVTRALDILEAKNFIERNRDDIDRRIQNVGLTDDGRNTATETTRFGMVVNNRISEILNQDECDNFENILRQLVDHLQTNQNNGNHNGS